MSIKAVWNALAVATVIATTPAFTQTVSTTTAAPKLKAIDAIVNKGISEHVFPGAVVVVGQPGKVLWAKAYGRMTYDETSAPMKLNTMFDLASVSKIMGTATAAMLLLDDGKLSLDDRVSSVIAGFDANGKGPITVRNLLTHTSALPAYTDAKKAEAERKPGETTADALIKHIATLKPRSEAGTTVVYSCLNMLTQARLNETILGTRQDALLSKRVWQPLGMKDTAYLLTHEQKSRCAPTVLHNDGSMLAASVHDPLAAYYTPKDHCPGNAGLFSSAPDAARFCEMILNGGKLDGKRVLSARTVKLMTSVSTPPGISDKRALGWDVYPQAPYATPLNQTTDTLILAHTGYTGTLLWLDKKSKTYLVFFTNRVFPDDKEQPKGHPSITSIRKDIIDVILRSLPDYRRYFAQSHK